MIDFLISSYVNLQYVCLFSKRKNRIKMKIYKFDILPFRFYMETKNNNKWGKWLILSVGILFTLYSIFLFVLVLYGTETNAKITSYRQEYGERNEIIRNQYTYLYGYEFEYQGKVYTGTGQKIGNSIFLKNNGNSFITVRFLHIFPQINSTYEEKNTLINLFISIGIGLGLIYLTKKMN
jgi:hypothetical protein